MNHYEAARLKALQQLKEDWLAYERDLRELMRQYCDWPEFGFYLFPTDLGGDPQTYTQGNATYEFDWDNSKVLPENGKSFLGYVVQTKPFGHGFRKLVALLIEERERPRELVTA